MYQLRKSYSLTDLGNQDELDDGSNPMGMAGHGRFRQLPQITDITGNFFVPGLWSVWPDWDIFDGLFTNFRSKVTQISADFWWYFVKNWAALNYTIMSHCMWPKSYKLFFLPCSTLLTFAQAYFNCILHFDHLMSLSLAIFISFETIVIFWPPDVVFADSDSQ